MAGERGADNGGRGAHGRDQLHTRHRRQEHLILELTALDRAQGLPHPLRAKSASGCASRTARPRSRACRRRARCRFSRPTNGIVWDSLAILEYLAEHHPECRLWPQDAEARAAARSISAEMHSGFAALRNDMSMDLLARLPSPPMTAALEADIRRIVAIWHDARTRFGKERALPVRDLHQCRCHVRAGGDAFPHLWRRLSRVRR